MELQKKQVKSEEKNYPPGNHLGVLLTFQPADCPVTVALHAFVTSIHSFLSVVFGFRVFRGLEYGCSLFWGFYSLSATASTSLSEATRHTCNERVVSYHGGLGCLSVDAG